MFTNSNHIIWQSKKAVQCKIIVITIITIVIIIIIIIIIITILLS